MNKQEFIKFMCDHHRYNETNGDEGHRIELQLLRVNLRGVTESQKPWFNPETLGGDIKNFRCLRAELFSGIIHMAHAAFDNSNFAYANLRESDIQNSSFVDACFVHANLGGCNMSGCNMRRADLFQAYCYETDFSHADLSDVNFDGAALISSNIAHANLGVINNLAHADCLYNCTMSWDQSLWVVNHRDFRYIKFV